MPGFLKRAGREETRIGDLVATVGSALADARELIDTLSPSWVVQTAVGSDLDALGAARGVIREAGEMDGDYRPRVRDAWKTAVSAGTQSGLVSALALAGFETRLWEPIVASATTWNPPLDCDLGACYLIPRTRPASCDDGTPCDEGRTCDLVVTAGGLWAGHGGDLAARIESGWAFVTPPADFVVRARDEQNRLYTSSGPFSDNSTPGAAHWGHALLQVIAITDSARATSRRFLRELAHQLAAHVRLIVGAEIGFESCDISRPCDKHQTNWFST